MNQFIEECHREWRRLRVPKSVADDMAAELESDLAEAATEGVTPEQFLGSDAGSFAQSWAVERGIARSGRRKRLVLALLAVLLCLAVVGATMAIVADPSRPSAKPFTIFPPPPRSAVRIQASTGNVQVVLREDLSGDSTRTVGLVLLLVGLGGAIAVTAASLTTRRRHTLRF